MATCLQFLERAMRALKVKGAGAALAPDEASDGLVVFQDLYYDLVDNGADLTDVLVSADYTAGENERVFNTSGSPVTITSPTTVEDTSIVPDANGDQLRAPREYAVISIAGSPRQTRVYDAYLGSWTEIESLELTDTPPWSTQLGQGLVGMLALLLQPEYGGTLTPTLEALAGEARNRLIGRMQMSAGSVFFQPDRRWPTYP